ncbi:hypothetical protein LTR62_004193 [Meristemomyces frigidus]|uniref:DUF7820 domain-containing protein n=1 Tax=Meristemomyces frigidus TaxID=1508187 RepID=A0AAN7YJP2_9PEZI|nr:hypothetical protein LTR62_004193 [Meristemomyces frigidus]
MDTRLLDGEVTPVAERDNVFDDVYEADEDFDRVADGFRPSDHDREGGVRWQDDDSIAPVRTTSIYSTRSHRSLASSIRRETSGAFSRSSMRKSRGQDNPFASPQDDERTPSLTFEPDMTHRSVSSASSHNFASTASPRFSAGPSHPYGMYPQGTMPRSPSVATQSTLRASVRQSISQDGPQHPYTMYPQGVGEEEDDDEHAAQNLVPIGFSGLGQSYRRQLGPEGEEQDIIGADGHAEQLPPYTRYPEDGPEKIPLLAAPTAPTALHSRAPVAGTDPTMPLMHDTLRPPPTPEPQSMTDESTLLRSTTNSLANEEAMNTTSSSKSMISYKSWSEKSWKEKRKTRVCGIPFWWILLTMSVLVFIAVVLGGVIGGFVMGQNRKSQNVVSKPSSTLYDASAIATPAINPPTGTYKLPLSTPQETQAACLVSPAQQAAWSCDLAGQAQQALKVYQPTGNNQSGAELFYAAAAADNQISYGAQQCFMETAFAPFIAVRDNDAVQNGPAFYFQQFYDKVVVVPETALAVPTGSSGKSKRQGLQLDQGWLQQKTVVQPGQKPWFCVWNNTFVEGFIYVQQPALTTSYNIVVSSATPTPNVTSGTVAAPPVSPPTMTAAGSPTVFMTTTVTVDTQTATFTGPTEAYQYWSAHALGPSQGSNGKSHSYNGNGDGDGDGYNKKRQAPDMYATLQQYPYTVKIEERRLSGNTIQPYCQQYQILDDGGYGLVVDPVTQNPIMIQLDEQDPNYSAYQHAGMAGSKSKRLKRGLVANGCHCQWISGQTS